MVVKMKSASKGDDSQESKPKKIKFRNYAPTDQKLKEKQLEKIRPAKLAENLTEHIEKGKPQAAAEEVDLSTLAPRKPDWDLKRDVNKKLEKLEKRTQKAIIELIRERLQEGDDDLASAVNAMTDK